MVARIEIDRFGAKRYFYNEEPYREDGPAVIWPDGTKIWVPKSKTSGPTNIIKDGTMTWRNEMFRHRSGGPSSQQPNGLKLWFEQGKRIWPAL